MKYESRFMMNEGLLFLSYAYALTGFPYAAFALAISSAVMAVICHSPGRFFDNLPAVICCVLIQLPLLLVSGLSGMMETMAVLAFCNAVVSVLWMESSMRAIRSGMRILLITFPVFLYLCVLIPEAALVFVIGQKISRASLLLLCLMMFLPVLSAYAFKRKRKKRRRVYNRIHSGKPYDRLADRTIY